MRFVKFRMTSDEFDRDSYIDADKIECVRFVPGQNGDCWSMVLMESGEAYFVCGEHAMIAKALTDGADDLTPSGLEAIRWAG